MKVKTLKEHSNRHGDKFTKAKGDVYDHSDPAPDIKFGYVEPVEQEKTAGGAVEAEKPKKTTKSTQTSETAA